MIPSSIQIKNFLSYGSPPQTISFEPYHLIYLCGKNGHGKSALLDAMTWALWGHARKVHTSSKPDQGLMRIGSQHMAVVFDWIVHNQRYRVRREVILQPSKATVNLDFGIVTELGAFKPLTDKTIRATQERINATIGLDYDGFIASAFIRQGNSHEFSRRAPQERKELLAQILGIGTYETIRKKALAELRELENQRERHTTQEALYADAPNQLLTIRTRINECETTRAAHLSKISDLTTTRDRLSQEHRALVTERAELGAQIRVHELQAARLEQEIELLKSLLAKRKSVTSTQSAHHALTAEYAAARAREESIRNSYTHAHTIREQLLIYEQGYLTKRSALKELYLAEHNALLLKKEIIVARRKKLTEEYAHHQATEIPEITEAAVGACKKKYERAQRSYDWCRAEQALYAARSAVAITPETTNCPTCTQSIDSVQAACLSILHTRITQRAERLARVIRAFELRMSETEKAYLHAQSQYTLYRAWHTDTTRLHETAQAVAHEEQAIEQEITALKERCTARAREQEAIYTAQITAHKETIAQAPDSAALIAAEAARRALEERLITISTQGAPHERARVRQEIFKSIAQIRLHKNAQKRAFELSALLIEKDAVHTVTEKTLQNLTNEISATEVALRDGERELGSLYALNEKALAEEQLLQKARIEREALDDTIATYRAAILVLSKDGIPALLIEEALPELENAANDLLARLTDNQSHLRFESIRDLKNGGTRETLDIIISDALGTRPYEMFSGGEAFRIDFALRVALSQLLARRAGTTLQTLIIDEGFGSQDEEGLSRIMDALYRVQDQFAKIIIVSHLPAMKDQFPVHFSVIKRPTGSFVQVVEQA